MSPVGQVWIFICQTKNLSCALDKSIFVVVSGYIPSGREKAVDDDDELRVQFYSLSK